MRKIFAAILTVVILLTFFACNDKEVPTIVSVRLKEGSVKETYDVDEEFLYGDARLIAEYNNGDTAEIEVTGDMLAGFDTATTGEKVLTVTYGDFVAEESYRVVYSSYPAKEILTPARLRIEQSYYPTGVGRTVTLVASDLQVRAISFTVKSSTDIFSSNLSTLDVSSEWSVRKYFVNPKTVKFLLYSEQAVAGASELTVFGFAGEQNINVSLVDITVSDGVSDYYLPDTPSV